jgi:hypothetical protein
MAPADVTGYYIGDVVFVAGYFEDAVAAEVVL